MTRRKRLLVIGLFVAALIGSALVAERITSHNYDRLLRACHSANLDFANSLAFSLASEKVILVPSESAAAPEEVSAGGWTLKVFPVRALSHHEHSSRTAMKNITGKLAWASVLIAANEVANGDAEAGRRALLLLQEHLPWFSISPKARRYTIDDLVGMVGPGGPVTSKAGRTALRELVNEYKWGVRKYGG